MQISFAKTINAIILLCMQWFFKAYFFATGKSFFTPLPSTIDAIKKFVEFHKKRFFCEKNIGINLNSNISSVFYDVKQYTEIIRVDNNPLEQEWKARIMYQNTPYGNVIMFYDAYKHGFAYYADVNVNYAILNALAMKYVTVYHCKDFFLDEETFPEEQRELTFLKIIRELEKDENGHNPALKSDFADFKADYEKNTVKETKCEPSPFLISAVNKCDVVKKYPPIGHIDKQKSIDLQLAQKNSTQKEDKKLHKNKFIYLGKISNFRFCKKQPIVQQKLSVPNVGLTYQAFKLQKMQT